MKEVERITDPFKIAFPNLGWEFRIDPTAFTIFGIDIQWYGLIITLGLVLAMIYCFPRMKRVGIDSDRAVEAVIGGIIGGIIGARVYYVAFRWDAYAGDWKSIFNFRGGGLAIYGGLIGALIVGLLICKIRKVKILPMLDISCIGFLIGQGVGRWGNFVNQEAFGRNTDSLFAMTGGTIQQTIINEAAMSGGTMYQSGVEISEKYGVHPCFLYESFWCLLGFVLLSLFLKHRKYDGQVFLMYIAWYGVERFFVEGLRTDSLMLGNIRISQALSAVIAVASIILQIVFILRYKRDPESFVLYCDTEESKAMLARSAESGKNGKKSESDEDPENGQEGGEETEISETDSETGETVTGEELKQEDNTDGSDN